MIRKTLILQVGHPMLKTLCLKHICQTVRMMTTALDKMEAKAEKKKTRTTRCRDRWLILTSCSNRKIRMMVRGKTRHLRRTRGIMI